MVGASCVATGLLYRAAQPVTAYSQVVGLGVHVDARTDVLADALGNVLREPVAGVILVS